MVMTDTTVGTTDELTTTAAASAVATDSPSTSTPEDDLLPEGTKVEVRSTLDQRWSGGFEVVSAEPGGYRLRRSSDDAELAGQVPIDHVRRERKRSTWWI